MDAFNSPKWSILAVALVAVVVCFVPLFLPDGHHPLWEDGGSALCRLRITAGGLVFYFSETTVPIMRRWLPIE